MEIRTYTAFVGMQQIATGPVEQLLPTLKPLIDRDHGLTILIFEDDTGKQIDFDFRAPLPAPSPVRTGPGRPKLGVVPREVSLLPRHWEWLEKQPSGASAALRRLVDEARRKNPGEEQKRLAIEAASRFLSAMAGDLPDYEEVTRALFNRDEARFEELMAAWPDDIREHAKRLATAV